MNSEAKENLMQLACAFAQHETNPVVAAKNAIATFEEINLYIKQKENADLNSFSDELIQWCQENPTRYSDGVRSINKMECVKMLRSHTGWMMKEAQEWCEKNVFPSVSFE